MIQISYTSMNLFITIVWILVRALCNTKNRKINWKREAQLLLVYVCIMVVVRFTFFPFSKVDGKVQPLIWDMAKMLPFRINLIPFVHLMDYVIFREAMINLIGNITMFIPIGVIFPIVYKELDTPKKAIMAGIAFSLCIEILQLPFYDRVTDIDDLWMNSVGYVMGYALYVLARKL